MAVAALVLGILGLVFSWVPFIGWILVILAVIFGAVGVRNPQGKGMAIAGLVLGIIGIALKVLFWIGIFSSL
jgi:hypothetical protein